MMILCDFQDLNKEQFHLQLFEAIVQGNMPVVLEVLKHPLLSKQFDISYRNYHCIIASILNSQHANDCHLDFLHLFTQSPILKKHAQPSLCNHQDIFCGPLGNAIIFTPIETVRFIGQFFNDTSSHLQDFIALSIFNNRKEAFFYLVKERQFMIKKPEVFMKSIVNFPHIDTEIVQYIQQALNIKNQSAHNCIDQSINKPLDHNAHNIEHYQSHKNFISMSHRLHNREVSHNKLLSHIISDKSNIPYKKYTTLQKNNHTNIVHISSVSSWGSQFRKKF